MIAIANRHSLLFLILDSLLDSGLDFELSIICHELLCCLECVPEALNMGEFSIPT